MNAFVQRHVTYAIGSLSGWDRLRFSGHTADVGPRRGAESVLCYSGVLLKGFG